MSCKVKDEICVRGGLMMAVEEYKLIPLTETPLILKRIVQMDNAWMPSS